MKQRFKKLIFLLLLVAFLIGLHQYFLYGIWFELGDMHHETFIVGVVCIILGLIIGDRMTRKR